MISFQDFQKMELRAAKILDVGDILGKDKLYKLRVDLGSEQRQIVAGLRQHYSREELLGKSIVVVSNLQPANIAGVESQAMLLAAKGAGGKYRLVVVDESVSPGTRIE